VNETSELNLEARLEHYRSFQAYESHFNNLQATLRGLASVWLLSALGAFAFLLQAEGAQLAIQRELAIAVVSLLGTVGLAVLWTIDQLVYQRLLASVFIVGLKMEFDFPDIPPMRTTMLLNAPSERGGMTPLLRIFYLVPIATLVSVGVASTIIFVEASKTVYWLRVAAAAAAVIVALLVLMASLRQSESMVDRARDIGGDDFASYVSRVRQEAPERLQGHEMKHAPESPTGSTPLGGKSQ
jgi:hypothetical protein